MAQQKSTLGEIRISLNAVATIAYHAALQCYGVVGIVHQNKVKSNTTVTDQLSRGVIVHREGDVIDIIIIVIMEFGVPINSVSENVAKTVQFTVEEKLGLCINSVSVQVADLRFNTSD